MQTQSTFTNAGWDFINETANGSDDVWAMSSSITFNGYPTVQWTGAYSEAPSGSPYQIASLPNLVWITENDTHWSNSYIQTADINAWTTPSWDDGKGWTPIGFSSQDFTGSYDGDGYTIDNLYINRPSDDEVALFSDTDDANGGATITNVGVTNVDITGLNSVGGLVGWHGTGCTVSYSYTTGSVHGEHDGSGGNYVGGIIGYNNGGTISNSYSTASVSGYASIGGLVGYTLYGTIEKCYATGLVSGTDTDIGGLVGNSSGADINNSFWDTETSGQGSSDGGTGKTTAEMQRATTFLDAGWDFTLSGDVWAMNQDVNSSYPFLRMEGETPAHVWLGSAKSTDWGTAGNWSENSTTGSTNNVIIPDVSNDPAISNDPSSPALSGKLTIEPAAVLTVSAGDALTVNSDLSNSGTLSINSSSSGTGSLIINGTISGDATVERYIEGYTDASNGWHLLSPPIGSFTINNNADFDPGTNDDVYGWSESSYTWMNHKQGNPSDMVPGTGYLVSYASTATKNFTGTLNNSDITHSNLSVNADGNGWHLLGNPFPSALHWTESADWNITDFASGAKIMNPGGSYTDISDGGANQYIPAHQGFFVQATTDGSNSITIPKADREHNSTSFYKSEVNNLLTLKASQGDKYVETWLQMKAGATVDYDEAYDIHFLGGMEGTPYLYSLCDNDEYVSTNRIPEDINDTEIPLGFSVTNDGEITLEWKNLDSFENDVDISLTDLKTEKTMNLDETDSYTFTATTEDDVNRFMLNFKSAIGIDEQSDELEGVSIYLHNHRIFVNTGEELTNADISVYNTLGQLIRKELYKSGDKAISVDQTGAFIVRIQAEEGVATEKVIIH
ncbi:MAG: T9SS type A sorting domain-containing protein [Bacteroidales bacterium]|nr:T9SS type A sorting domain-containing protein [Bacteroidales bacterium]